MTDSGISVDWVALAKGLAQGAVSVVKESVARSFEPCGIPRCQNASVGARCGRCDRYVCLDHMAIRPEIPVKVPPKVQCACCLVAEFAHLVGEDHDARPRVRRR